MAENNGWRKVGGGEGSDNKTWDFKTTPEITGIYTSSKDVNTKDGGVSRLYVLETSDGPVTVWDKAALRSAMNDISLGEEVHITYLGQVQSKKNAAQKYHAFDVQARSQADKEKAESSESELPFLAE